MEVGHRVAALPLNHDGIAITFIMGAMFLASPPCLEAAYPVLEPLSQHLGVMAHGGVRRPPEAALGLCS